jgi:hypothetical protein
MLFVNKIRELRDEKEIAAKALEVANMNYEMNCL